MKTENAKTYQVLSIEAMAAFEPGEWEWNNWFHAGTIELTDSELDNPIESMIQAGFLKDAARELGAVDDDGHNVVILNKETREPIFAVVYGQ